MNKRLHKKLFGIPDFNTLRHPPENMSSKRWRTRGRIVIARIKKAEKKLAQELKLRRRTNSSALTFASCDGPFISPKW